MADWLADNLEGRYAHALSGTVFDGLPPGVAGRRLPGVPYTIWQVLQHMIWWQDWWLGRMAGDRPDNPPDLAATWDKREAPADEAAWRGAVLHFQQGLARAKDRAARDLDAPVQAEPPGTVGSELVQLMAHNSYHVGQVVLLRRLLGCWPPQR